jgi:hypothetical protein
LLKFRTVEAAGPEARKTGSSSAPGGKWYA